MPAAPGPPPAGRRATPRKKHMSTTIEEATDLTQRIQARDGVAVVVYTKNECFGCTKTKEKLDENKIHYTTVNVEEDATAYWYVTEHLGYRQMPVVEVSTIEGNVIWSGLQPTKIREHITHRADAA